MDPLSVAASVAGLIIAGAQITSMLQKLSSGAQQIHSYASSVQSELNDFTLVLSQLQPFVLGSALVNPSRSSMIDVDQVLVTLTGSVCTFSDLEKEVTRLGSQTDMTIRNRMRWVRAESTLRELVDRLQRHKISLTLILTILTCGTSSEAVDSMNRLQTSVDRLVESNKDMANRLQSLESRFMTPGQQSLRGTNSITTVQTTTSYRLAFEAALFNTRLYKRTLLNSSALSFVSSSQRSARWSILSGVSLAEISNISILSLPISGADIFNSQWYANNPEGPSGVLDNSRDTTTNHYEDNDSLSVTETIKANETAPPETPQPGHSRIPSVGTRTTRKSSSKARREHHELILAAMRGDHETLLVLLQQGVAVDAMIDGRTSLMWAVVNGHHQVVRTLLESGASTALNIPLHGEDQPMLHHAAMRGQAETVRVFLEHGVDPNANNLSGKVPLQLAAIAGNHTVVDILLEFGSDIETTLGRYPMLQHAASKGDLELARVLLTRGARTEVKDEEGRTCLHLATWNRHHDMVQLLIEHGANMETRQISGRSKYTPLHLASICGDHKSALVLIQHGADKAASDGTGQTALHLALIHGSSDVVRILLEAGADPEFTDNSGHTALQLASKIGLDRSVQVLLEGGADVQARNGISFTPLHLAARSGYLTIIEVLLSHGADLNARAGEDGPKVLEMARKGGHDSVATFLLTKCATPTG